MALQAGPGAPRDLRTTQANSHQELMVAAEKVGAGETWRSALPGHMPGLDHPRLGCPGEGV